MAGNLEVSLQYFQDALDIFEPTHDEEWLSVIYTWRGAAYISSKPYDLSFAERDLLRARAINIPKEQPMTLSRLGLLYLLQNDLEKAESALLECKKLAYDLPDVWYQWIVIRDLARLARYQKKYAQLDSFEAEMQAYLRQYPKPDERALGMLHIELGSLALGLGQQERAIQHYYEGIKTLTATGNYGGDTPIIYLERLQQEVFEQNLRLPPAQIQQIGAGLLKKWQAEKLHIHYPNLRSVFSQWATWEKTNL
jgi:tetratricopeptide (TPR) repeat protein